MINITLPNTPEVRAVLRHLGDYLTDDMTTYFQEFAKELAKDDLQHVIVNSTTLEQMEMTCAIVDAAFLWALDHDD